MSKSTRTRGHDDGVAQQESFSLFSQSFLSYGYYGNIRVPYESSAPMQQTGTMMSYIPVEPPAKRQAHSYTGYTTSSFPSSPPVSPSPATCFGGLVHAPQNHGFNSGNQHHGHGRHPPHQNSHSFHPARSHVHPRSHSRHQHSFQCQRVSSEVFEYGSQLPSCGDKSFLGASFVKDLCDALPTLEGSPTSHNEAGNILADNEEDRRDDEVLGTVPVCEALQNTDVDCGDSDTSTPTSSSNESSDSSDDSVEDGGTFQAIMPTNNACVSPGAVYTGSSSALPSYDFLPDDSEIRPIHATPDELEPPTTFLNNETTWCKETYLVTDNATLEECISTHNDPTPGIVPEDSPAIQSNTLVQPCTPAEASQPPCSDEPSHEHNSDDEVTLYKSEQPVQQLYSTGFNPYTFMKHLSQIPYNISQNGPLLPPKSPCSLHPTIVLDLDETLVHCYCDPLRADFQFPVCWEGKEFQMHVRKRPYLEYFLEEIVQYFEVIVFTASHPAYADALLNLVDPCGKYFSHRLFRDSCTVVDGAYLKDLSMLNRDLSTTCIVDNSPVAYGLQVDNGIPIPSWYDNDSDTELLDLLPFLKSLSSTSDFRVIIRDNFGTHKLIEDA
ncbi:CTD phosphatase [Pelomyxa schiedti]|nr:CTD phosphatase [Pelomyxa schiedti]